VSCAINDTLEPEKIGGKNMTEQILPLVNRINSIEQQLRDLSDEKRGLEKELSCFLLGDDGIKDSRVANGK
jgi:hypothetical protein